MASPQIAFLPWRTCKCGRRQKEEERGGEGFSGKHVFKNWILMWTPTPCGHVNTIDSLCTRQLPEKTSDPEKVTSLLQEAPWQKQRCCAISEQHRKNIRDTRAPRNKGGEISGIYVLPGTKVGTVAPKLEPAGGAVEVRESSGRGCVSAVLHFPSTWKARLDWIVTDTGTWIQRLSHTYKVFWYQIVWFFFSFFAWYTTWCGQRKQLKNEADFWRCLKRGVQDGHSQDSFNSGHLFFNSR